MPNDPEFTSLAEAVRRLVPLAQVLSEDVHALWREVASQPTPLVQRNCVRATFAAMEGLTFGIKAVVVSFEQHSPIQLAPHHAAALREETYRVTAQGQVKVVPSFTSLQSSIRLAFDLAARYMNVRVAPDFSGKGWQAMGKAIRTRNRIVHPRFAADLDLTSKEMDDTRLAWHWYRTTLTAFIAGLQSGLQSETWPREPTTPLQ